MAVEMWTPAGFLIREDTQFIFDPVQEEGYSSIHASAPNTAPVRFAIPTPAIISDNTSRVDSVMFIFTTNLDGGPLGTLANGTPVGSRITRIQVHDGSELLVEQPNLAISGGPEALHRFKVPNSPPVRRGINMSLSVQFEGQGAAIRFHAAGARFV